MKANASQDVRGVVEALHSPDGFKRYTVVTSQGQVLFDGLVASRLATPALIGDLHKLLDAEDPRPRLRLVPTAGAGGRCVHANSPIHQEN